MNIALFAADTVGYEVAKYFGEKHEPLACLVLDSEDKKGLNAQLLTASGIKDYDSVFDSDSLCKKETLCVLKKMDLDLVILAWWPYMVKEDLIKIPRLGFLGFHPGYLPFTRGKDPNFWAIAEDVPYGVSLFFADKGIDKGDIAFQSIIEKTWEDTGGSLYEKALREVLKLFKDNFSKIKSGNIPRKPQDLSRGSFHLRKELDPASMIDLDKSYTARKLLNLIRARTFYPHPAVRFIEGGQMYEVRIDIKTVDG